jgi:predicted CXXCH cytochrome family protein
MRTIVVIALAMTHLFGPGPEDEAGSTVGLTGSKHDFSAAAWSNGDRCAACHGPSVVDRPVEAPLWNPSADFERRFGSALAHQASGQPGPGTLVCMRCHDGTLAADMFGGLTSPAAANIHHPVLFTSAHSANHPVGVAYPEFDPEFRPLHAIVSEGLVALPNGRVECVSCHDPHNEYGLPDMLTKSNARSALCLTCHLK